MLERMLGLDNDAGAAKFASAKGSIIRDSISGPDYPLCESAELSGQEDTASSLGPSLCKQEELCAGGDQGVEYGSMAGDGRRIVYRCAQLGFNKMSSTWRLEFKNIKVAFGDNPAEYDELRIVLSSPDGIDVYRHDGKLGLSTTGKETAITGHSIFLVGSRNDKCCKTALGTIHKQLNNSDCVPLLKGVLWSDSRVIAAAEACPPTTAQKAYDGLPLATSSNRGIILQTLAYNHDMETNPSSSFEDAANGRCIDGRTYDYMRDGVRIECKSAQLAWSEHHRRWRFLFAGIKFSYESKPAAFDELRIILYTPEGVYIVRHNQELGITTAGKATATKGHYVALYGKKDETDPSAALKTILDQLQGNNCKLMTMHSIPLKDPRVKAATEEHPLSEKDEAYAGTPLLGLTGQRRARVLKNFAAQALAEG